VSAQQGRVLIIEDDEGLLRRLQGIISRAGYEVDTATTKPEALEKARCRTYHVAMIDIMLSDDPSDRGGIDCLEYISRLDEGTNVIVLSHTDDVRVPVDAWKKGALTYLVKKDIRSSEEILKELRQAFETCTLSLYGPYSTLSAYLSGTNDVMSFEQGLMNILGRGKDRINSVLEPVFAPLLPVLRPKHIIPPVSANAQKRVLTSLVWSKAAGGPLWLSISTESGELLEPPDDCRPFSVLREQTKKRLFTAKTWQISKPRDYFEETMYEAGS